MLTPFGLSPRLLFFALVLYINYGIVGVGQIVIAQHMDVFMLRFSISEVGVAVIMAGIGLGRVLGYPVAGILSDYFGRKPLVIAGGLGQAFFFLTLLTAHNPTYAFIAAVVGGIADSCFDTGTYPALMEAFPKAPSASIIGAKISISFGQIGFPLFVALLSELSIGFGWAFSVTALVVVINLGFVCWLKFPSFSRSRRLFCLKGGSQYLLSVRQTPRFLLDGLPLIVFSSGAYLCFGVVMLWMPYYSRLFGGATYAQSLTMISFFASGAVLAGLAVMLFAARFIRPVILLAVLPFLTALAALTAYLFPSLWVCRIVSFCIGATASSGVLQIGLSVMALFFPSAKARVTSLYMLASSLTSTCLAVFLGMTAASAPRQLMLINSCAGVVCFLAGCFVIYRFYRVFSIPPDKQRLGEKHLIAWIAPTESTTPA